jgi:hypothetical protein
MFRCFSISISGRQLAARVLDLEIAIPLADRLQGIGRGK